nr:hypothetical protein [Bacteroidales bacterium]
MKLSIRKYGRRIKAWYYRNRYNLKYVSKTSYFCGPFNISSDLITEDYTYIGPNCRIYPRTRINKFTILANDVSIIGGDHRFDVVGLPIYFTGRDVQEATIIGSDCWIGAHVIIKRGVNISDGCVIAMGSVVTKDTEPYGIYAGVPAKRIGERFGSSEEIEIHKKRLQEISSEDAEMYILGCRKMPNYK